MKKPQIFVSYTSKDRKWAGALARSLEEQGMRVWFDEKEIDLGDKSLQRLERALRESDWVVFLINERAEPEPGELFAMGAALALPEDKRVVAIVPKEMKPSQIPFPLRSRAGMVKESPERTAKRLVEAVQATAGNEQRS